MNILSYQEKINISEHTQVNTAVDTTFVLFFLAIELGQSFNGFSLDRTFLGISLLLLLVLPYFLLDGDRPEFGKWLMGRSVIAIFALGLGVLFGNSLGVILPDGFRFLPMTLLIISAMLCCYIQFYGFLKLRFVR